MKEDVKTEHESWCLVQANRVSGRSDDLFATSLEHQHTIQIKIARAAQYSGHGSTRYMDREQLIAIEMSPMQWAEFITTMNMGCGVPCTLRRFEGKAVKGQKHETETVRIQDQFSQHAKAVGEKMRDLHEDIASRLEKTSLSKKAQGEILEKIYMLTRVFHDYMPFMHDRFVEACESTVSEAKAAVDAFVSHAVLQTGLEYLAEHAQQRLIGVKGEGDVE
jgi:hypothetical protein